MDSINGVKMLVAVNVPLTSCNLKGHYCYISQMERWQMKAAPLPNPETIGKALSAERLGGKCIINITGRGETLIPKEMPAIIGELLDQGHYLEVVTNGTLTKRFKEISRLPREHLRRVEFKFSFHYLELVRLGWIERFFDNVKMMRDAGCSFTLELMPSDELIPYIDEIKQVCFDNVGALCHLTIGRDDTDGRKILTSMSTEDYIRTWNGFNSDMFSFKWSVYGQRRKEFCYAGMYSLYVDLTTGDVRQCYGCLPSQNLYDNLEKPLLLRPVGKCCKQEFCYNAHAYLSLGLLPELNTPTYADIRDRVTVSGGHWLGNEITEAFSTKLVEANGALTPRELLTFYAGYPMHWFRLAKTNWRMGLKKALNLVKGFKGD